jgi:hypothetical protein
MTLNNKQNIYIYQIFCKDHLVNENYIGQTECFEQRKYSHQRSCKDSDLKLYKIIREKGGWDNWEMKILNHYYCDQYEARQIEQKYIDIFKATLNSVRAYSKPFINEELDRLIEFQIQDFSNKILGCYLYDYLDLDEFNLDKQICNHCNNEFINLISLRSHQKKSKYCLKLQNKEFICNGCNKIFHISIDLDNHKHKHNCTHILKQKIILLETHNKSLEDKNKYYKNKIEFYEKHFANNK